MQIQESQAGMAALNCRNSREPSSVVALNFQNSREPCRHGALEFHRRKGSEGASSSSDLPPFFGLRVHDVVGFETCELLLDLRGFLVGMRNDADGDAALAENLFIGTGVGFGNAQSDEGANQAARDGAGAGAGQGGGNR